MNLSFILIASMPTKGMKSMGNVTLLPLNKRYSILEKHIHNISSVFPTAEIVVVGGFENKKMYKLLNKYKNIKYVYHTVKSYSNETQSLYEGIKKCKNTKCIALNANCVTHKNFWNKLKHRTKKSIVILNSNKNFNGNVGATIKGKEINYIFFGLPHKITNIYILQKNHMEYFINNYCEQWISKYLFETINILCKYDPMYYENTNNNIFIINNIKDYNKITKKEAYV